MVQRPSFCGNYLKDVFLSPFKIFFSLHDDLPGSELVLPLDFKSESNSIPIWHRNLLGMVTPEDAICAVPSYSSYYWTSDGT